MRFATVMLAISALAGCEPVSAVRGVEDEAAAQGTWVGGQMLESGLEREFCAEWLGVDETESNGNLALTIGDDGYARGFASCAYEIDDDAVGNVRLRAEGDFENPDSEEGRLDLELTAIDADGVPLEDTEPGELSAYCTVIADEMTCDLGGELTWTFARL